MSACPLCVQSVAARFSDANVQLFALDVRDSGRYVAVRCGQQAMVPVTPGSELRQVYAHESQEIRQRFLASSDGRECIAARAALLDRVVSELFAADTARAAQGRIAVVAIGGYGRKTLFPHSDVDLLFLCVDENEEAEQKGNVATVTRELWDMRVRVSPVTRTLTECSKPQADNLEFTIALLDARLVCGSAQLFEELLSAA